MSMLSEGPHRCGPPYPGPDAGAIWRCGVCGRHWRSWVWPNGERSGWRRLSGWRARWLVRRTNTEGDMRRRDQDRATARIALTATDHGYEIHLPHVSRLRRLLEECDRADGLAGPHGGFVTTERIRQLIGRRDG